MIKRSIRLRFVVVPIVALTPLLAGLVWLNKVDSIPTSRTVAKSSPKALEPILALARVRRFAEAEASLSAYLERFPDDPKGHLLMARLATDRDIPAPAVALAHLAKVRERDPGKRAVVAFYQGKAHYQDGRYDRAETAWAEAIRLDPAVPEAGAALLNLLELEGRLEEAYRLGLRLHEVEPNPVDKVRLLLSVARLDLSKPSPESQAKLFAPIVAVVPDNIKLATTLGLALIRDSRSDAGLDVLKRSLEFHKDAPDAWDAYLKGLDEAGRPDILAEQFAALPKAFAADVRFARHRGEVAQFHRDWKAAAEAYRTCVEADPHDAVALYRLSRALKLANETEAARNASEHLNRYQAALGKLEAKIDEATGLKTLGLKPEPQLYQVLAELRETMGRPDEARAWHKLVLDDDPKQPVSLAAMQRLR